MAITYEDLYNKSGTIYNKKTSKGYASPTELARDLGISAEQIQWGNIGDYKAPQAQPASQAQPAQTSQVDYSQLINKGGTIYSKSGKGYATPEELARDLGVGAGQIQWGNIAKEQAQPQAQPQQNAQQQAQYQNLVNKGGTIVNTQTGKAYENPEQLAQDLGTQSDKIDWNAIAKAQPITYNELTNQDGTIVNKGTGKGYATPEELARDLGVAPENIQWADIAKGMDETPAPPVTPEAEKGQVAPTLNPETIKAFEEANKAYQASLQLSPEELSTQEEIDKLMESVKKGYEGTSNQAIPMEFITGQLKAIENRALGLMEPLQDKMARLQAKRTGAVEASKFALETAKSNLDAEKAEISEAKKTAESARRFDKEQDLAYKKELQDAIEFEAQYYLDLQQMAIDQDLDYSKLIQKEQSELRAYNLSEAKYNEDVRQYGLDYAQKNRQIAISASREARLASESGEDGKKLTETQKKNQAILELEDDIRKKMPSFDTREKLIEYLAPFYLELSKDDIAEKVYYIVGDDNKINR